MIPFDDAAGKAKPIWMLDGHFLKGTHLGPFLAFSIGKKILDCLCRIVTCSDDLKQLVELFYF